MAHKHHISITANSGVGSTTTSKKLHALLGYTPWRWVNAGAIMRIFADEKKMTIEEFTRYMTEHIEEAWDKKCDDMMRYFGEQDFVIFEGRIVHHFTPNAFHVHLICDPHIRAERRAKDAGVPVDQMFKRITERDVINDERYKIVYGEKVLWNPEKFDLIIDTVIYNPDEVSQMILDAYQRWQEK